MYKNIIGFTLLTIALLPTVALAQPSPPSQAKLDPQLQATLDVLQDRLMMALQKDINAEIAIRAAHQELAAEKTRAEALAAWWASYVKGRDDPAIKH